MNNKNIPPHEELLKIAADLEENFQIINKPEINDSMQALLDAVNQINKSFSGSWLGYHSSIYYRNFTLPPAGAHFSMEWGLQETYGSGTTGDWVEYDQEKVKKMIFEMAGYSDLTAMKQIAVKAKKIFEDNVSEVLSILNIETSSKEDDFLITIKVDIEKLKPLRSDEILNRLNPSKGASTRDAIAVGQGFIAPAHSKIQAQLVEIHSIIEAVNELGKLSKKASSHLARQVQKIKTLKMTGTHIFIGHGNSPIWKDLKDFVKDTLNLPYDEFNRVPIAGITNVARLSDMLESAAIAFIILTGEDEQSNGNRHARMNAIHEAGLFQGKLGFSKAIILLEEGCEEFSNIAGLGQIRFPKDNISASFEEIRRVLKRENLTN